MDTNRPDPNPLPPYGSPEEPPTTPRGHRFEDESPIPPQPPRTPPGARLFDTVRSWGVVRPDDDRWVGGVAAGLARRWTLNPGLVRLPFVVGGLTTGIGLAVYGVLWLLLPHPDGRIHAEQV